MSNMPGCSIDNICHSNSKLQERLATTAVILY
jgi:hypothetical protein